MISIKLPRARWKRILLSLAASLMLLIVVGFLLPGRAHIEKSILMCARMDAVFPKIATLKRWPEWSAWTVARFPDMKTRFEGPESGVGAVMIAEGKSSGDGTVTITGAEPGKGVWYDLDFEHGTQLFRGAITLNPSAEGLKVSWSLETEMGWNPLKRWGGLFLGTLMGGDMAEGLTKLKSEVEAVK